MFTPIKDSDNYNDKAPPQKRLPFLGRSKRVLQAGRPPAAVATQLWQWSFGGVLEGSVFLQHHPKSCCGGTGYYTILIPFFYMAGEAYFGVFLSSSKWGGVCWGDLGAVQPFVSNRC